MIISWKHKGLKQFYSTGNKAGIKPNHANKLKIILQRLNAAVKPDDMNTPGMEFHPLTGDKKGFNTVSISGNWRIKFKGKDAALVDYLDYH